MKNLLQTTKKLFFQSSCILTMRKDFLINKTMKEQGRRGKDWNKSYLK